MVRVTVDDEIEYLRGRIAELDQDIAALLTERRENSRLVQEARVGQGDSRISVQQENAVISRYAAALGYGGRRIALSVLEYCRGEV